MYMCLCTVHLWTLRAAAHALHDFDLTLGLDDAADVRADSLGVAW